MTFLCSSKSHYRRVANKMIVELIQLHSFHQVTLPIRLFFYSLSPIKNVKVPLGSGRVTRSRSDKSRPSRTMKHSLVII